ncbi:MAG: SDR family oxidoreductase [Sedimentisphaerales bacterium]|jgi:NAD(P)-dependent dehydrogenase (short-subunit alcohol dehydrogenase family)|nr:SDR family oxidoreductase [Sedimentisphaerales bacterium]
MQDLFDVRSKVVAITGGAGILCGTMAQALAQAGARICIMDFDGQRAEKLAKEITDKGGSAIAVKTDVLDRAQVEAAAENCMKVFGYVDCLVNGAGGNKKEATTSESLPFFDIPAEAIRWVFDLNLLGTVLPSQVFGRYMAQQGHGVIINISSMNAFRPLTRIPAYSAAKAAVSNFTQWLAVHMAQNYSPNIRVNAIAPGFFLTEQNRFLLTDQQTGQLTARGKAIIDHTPMARFGQPEELVGTLLWLISKASAFVTGVVVPVDGGFNAFSGV